MKTNVIRITALLLFVLHTAMYSQPFTKKYIMSFFTCSTNCQGTQQHLVHLAESDDGRTWTPVPNFVPYVGSVPDVVIRENKLYVYTPGFVKRYDITTDKWDPNPVPVSIVDSNNNVVNFVDPSAVVDSSGKIVLFFLNSTGIMGDPARCQSYPCTKYFDSAVEVEGSDGTRFVLQNGHRLTMQLNNNESAADPDVFFDGTNYYMYIANNGAVAVAKSNALHGSYSLLTSLPNGILTTEGSVPCGYYDAENNEYWTFVHKPENGTKYIKRAVHSDFSTQLTSFEVVLSGSIIGEDSLTTTESPGITLNTFLTTGIERVDNRIPDKFELSQNYPNPFNPTTSIMYKIATPAHVSLKVFDELGKVVAVLVNKEQSPGTYRVRFNASHLSSGVYYYVLNAGRFRETKKMVLLR